MIRRLLGARADHHSATGRSLALALAACGALLAAACSTMDTGSSSRLPAPAGAAPAAGAQPAYASALRPRLQQIVTDTLTPGAVVLVRSPELVSIYASSNTVNFACSDNKGNAYSQNVSAGGGGAPRSVIVAAHNVTALVSGDTITCAFPNSSTTSGMSVNEFSGLAPTPLDRTSAGAGTNSSVNSGLTLATTQANELVLGFVHAPSFTPATSSSNPSEVYADLPNSDPYHFAGQFGPIWPVYRIVSTSRQYQTNGTGGGSGGWRAMTATYKGF